MTAAARLLAVALVAIVARGAHAGPAEQAQPHIERAMELHANEQYPEALVELQAAYKLDPQPELHYALGQVYAKLDRCPDAIVHYEQFLASGPDAEAASEINGAIAACKAKLPAEAEPPPPPPEPVAAAPTRERRAWYKDKLGGGLVIGGALATIASVIVYRAAVSDLDEAETAPSHPDYEQLVDDAHAKRTYAVVLLGGGLTLVGAGVVRYLLRDRDEARTIAVSPAQGGGVVTWIGRF